MKAVEVLILSLIAVFAPIQAAIITAFVLIMADLTTGILASIKRKEKITSAGIKRTIVKIFIYELALCIGFLADLYLIGNILPATKLISTIIGLTELKSCLENLDNIYGSSIFSSIISKITVSQKDLNEKK